MERKEKASQKNPASLRAKVLCRVFSEDYERGKRKILDPRGKTMQRWNRVFLVACLVSLFIDPLFFYLQVVWEEQCINIGVPLEVILTAVRSLVDIFYMIQIYIRFRTAYVAPSSRVFGRGELIIDPSKIARRYLRRGFLIDFIAALPLPQVCRAILFCTSSHCQANHDRLCSLNDMIFPLYTGVDMGDHPHPWGFDNRQHEKRASLHYYFPIPPKTLSYCSLVITNCEGHRCCHGTSLGWSCL